ncbi:uncharacterized protein EV154DRAFT_524207 [Mucor mucedo]|uniref:uncharacterized protein n=1 Tax=Mucor mucedo TaxID=29922 RepID=UPI0022208F9D|nr:uncharacterized protein EV154DRAFT_524207 [Mucor mucedo]KAI7879826.1 hypothetical protein EV154DRAFT_524207 [Mucor mucedo]
MVANALLSRAINATCATTECITTAKSILADIDLNVDPCSDFYQYTCGSWIKNAVIQEDRTSSGTLETANDVNTDAMRAILEGTYEEAYKDLLTTDGGFHTEDLEITDKENFQAMQDYYKVCLNEQAINSLGPSPIYSDIAQIQNELFPVSDNDALYSIESKMLLSQTLSRFEHLGVSTLATLFVDADDKNPDKYAILFDQALLGLPSKEYYQDTAMVEKYRLGLNDILTKVIGQYSAGNDTEIRASESEKVGLTLWDPAKVESAVNRFIDFETKIANISLKNEDMQDPVKLYNPTKLSDFQSQNPLIDWTGILESLIPNGGIRSPDTIIVRTPEYYEKLNTLLTKETTLLALQEYLIIQFITAKVYSLDDISRAASHKMSGDISSGTSVEQPRWRICVGYTSNTFSNSLGRYYTLKKFGCEAERKRAESFLKTIHDAWLDRIPHIGWLDEQTRAKAVEKVNLINHKVGYSIISPDLRNPSSIKIYNDGLYVNKTSFYDTEAISSYWYSNKMWKKVGQEIDKDEWLMSPQTVNAYYTPNSNEIVIPAGILQSPFYNIAYPEYLNYGGIGMVIGHELTHAFDSSGRKYDGHGNLLDWWTNATSAQFEEKTKCFIDQYSKFNVTGPDNKVINVNGKLTLGENLADNGGISASFLAYQKTQAIKRDPVLEGLEQLSPEALFFINFGRVWCRKQREKASLQMIFTDEHSPSVARVNGVVQNSLHFAETFKCPVGSPMNPVKKCDMW